MLIKTKYSC